MSRELDDGSHGTHNGPVIVISIVEMAEPTDTVDLRQFLGMINQLMKFCPSLAEMTHPLRK